MGLMDHRKTRRLRVGAPAEQCVAKFTEAFTTGGRWMQKIDWRIIERALRQLDPTLRVATS